jgi:hypothetical protein
MVFSWGFKKMIIYLKKYLTIVLRHSYIKVVIAFSMMIFLTSCVSPKQVDLGVYDATVPIEQQSTLIIDGTLKITSFDNRKVEWYPGYFKYGNNVSSSIIQIPAGKHTFLMDYLNNCAVKCPTCGIMIITSHGGVSNSCVSAEKPGISITQDFEAGKRYRIRASATPLQEGSTRDYNFFIKINVTEEKTKGKQ